MVNYGFASATLALTAAAVATAQEAVTPQPTYWPTYWPTYSPTDVHDGKYDRHSPPARDGNPNYESSEKPTDPTPVRPSLIPPIAALTEGPTSSPTKEPTSSPTNAPTQRPQDQPTTPSPTASTDPPTQHPVAPPTTPPPPPTPQKWGSSWGDSASSSKSSWSNALKGDSKWGGSDSPKVMSLEWGGKADKWGGKTAKWGTSKAGKSWCNTTKSSKTEWSTGWESSEWQSPQPEWKSPEWQPPKQNWVSPGWESGSGWKRPKQPGSSARPGSSGVQPRPNVNPPGPKPSPQTGPNTNPNQPRCMGTQLKPIGAGLEKYPGLGADVLVSFNNALPEFKPSASIGMRGGNFPPSIVGGLQVHEGKSCNDIGSHFFKEGWSTLGAKSDGDPFYPEPTLICPSGAVFITDADGMVSSGGIDYANGYGYDDTKNRVVVVHDKLIALGGDYAPIACGVLKVIPCTGPDNAPRKLYTWPKRTYLNYDVEAAPESWEGVTPKADKEVPLWDDDGWSEPETSMTAWDSWSTSKASKATGEGWGLSMSLTTWDSWSTSKASKATGEGWGLAKASKWVGSKGGKSSCWESGDGGDNGSGWGWQPSWPSPPPTWGKPPAPTPPCVNNQSYNCGGLGGTGSWYCQGMVDGCADGQEYHPSCVVTEKPATEVCPEYCDETCIPTPSPTKSPTSSPT
ncbi:hypothetical protein ACHAWT_004011, partial [Skeletonema menzelii]